MFLSDPRDTDITFADPAAIEPFSFSLHDVFRRDPKLEEASGRAGQPDWSTLDRNVETFTAGVRAAERQTRLVETITARENALAEAAANRIETVRRLTGVQLENPFDGGYTPEAYRRVNERGIYGNGRDAARAEERRNIFNEKIDEVAQNFPEHAAALNFGQSLEDQASAIARGAAHDGEHAGGGILAALAGGLWGSRRDPLFLASLFVGPGASAATTVIGKIGMGALSSALYNAGLQALAQARKHVFALDFQAAVADQAGETWNTLNPYLKRTLAGYGLDRTAWDVIRATPAHAPEGGAGFIRPADVAALADGPALPKVQKLLGIDSADEAAAAAQTASGVRRIAEQYLEAMLQQTERAVPTGTARSRSVVTGTQPKGTFFGEVVESALLFKSFALSFTTMQLQAIHQELHQGRAAGAAYAGGIALALTMGGGIALQIKTIINGKDPMPMTDPRFWLQALQTGGGFGLLGDFMFADLSRQNQSLGATLMGPTIGAIDDLVLKLGVGNLQQLSQGKKTNAGREAVNTLGRYAPVVSSMWYLRGAYRRVFLDQLQYLLDPAAHKNWREQEQRLHSETRQGQWWRGGEIAPHRLPAYPR